jgi:hypothetical protein
VQRQLRNPHGASHAADDSRAYPGSERADPNAHDYVTQRVARPARSHPSTPDIISRPTAHAGVRRTPGISCEGRDLRWWRTEATTPWRRPPTMSRSSSNRPSSASSPCSTPSSLLPQRRRQQTTRPGLVGRCQIVRLIHARLSTNSTTQGAARRIVQPSVQHGCAAEEDGLLHGFRDEAPRRGTHRQRRSEPV